MRRTFFIAAITGMIFLLGSYSLNAQKGFQPVKLGLKVAPNIGWLAPGIKNYESDSPALGATLGFVADFYFAERYAFSSGFNFSFLNGSMKYPSYWPMEGNPTDSGTIVRKYNFIYFEVPTMVKMKTKNFGDFAFFGQIGFKTGFRISAKAKDEFSSDINAFSEKNPATDQTTLIRESVAVGIGLEYSLDTDSHLFFGIGYDNSLNNVLKGTNNKSGQEEKAWLNYIELNLGMLF